MRGPVIPIIVTVAVVAALIAALLWHPKPSAVNTKQETEEANTLLFYCAAGMRKPVDQIADAYRKEYGITIRLEYAGSGTLLSRLKVAGKGDLYLAGDSSYIESARAQGLVAEAIPLASLQPVIAVAKDNPLNIRSVIDLTREDVRTGLGAPEAASIGAAAQRLLTSLGLWDAVQRAVQARGVFKPTVNEVANDVKLGAIDAGVVWDVTVKQYPELEAIPLESSGDPTETVMVGVLTSSRHPTEALRCARYLAACDKGLPVFEKDGYNIVQGDSWAEIPEIVYFSGGVNRVAIEDTLKTFQEREGCVIKTVYNGCGILVGQMKLGTHPDAYHSCDASFMRDVTDLFGPACNISETPMVIVTAKGNPLEVHSLKDLTREGLRVGVANEEQSALGALTARLLQQEGLYDAVAKNVVATTPTADLLVNQITTGALDAVIVYEANMTYRRDDLDTIPIALPGAMAVQTFAIGKQTRYPYLVARLLQAIESKPSRDRYQQCGFREAPKS